MSLETKILEVRDKATFIPVVAVLMRKGLLETPTDYLLGRCGYGDHTTILLQRADGSGRSNSDLYSWGDRTMQVAHHYIEENWNKLKSGDVVCVEFILGERDKPKVSERLEHG